MTVREILIEWLKARNCDGLATEDCGCGIDDLAPCDSYNFDCKAARECFATEDDEDYGVCGIEAGDTIFKSVTNEELVPRSFDVEERIAADLRRGEEQGLDVLA
ncbi:MAG: hypothetical protein WC530_10515 [Candidatus Omnitrophota bacterium]